MQLEQGKIGYWQWILLMFGYIIGPSIVLVPGTKAEHNAWIAILLSIISGMLLFLASYCLCIRFRGKNLIQINGIVYGPFFGKVFSIAYLWFFFHVGSLILTTFKNFFLVTTLPQTPDLVIAMIIILTSAYAVKNGVEVLARCGLILVTVAIFSFLLSSLFLVTNINFGNLFPVFNVPINKLLKAAHESATFLYGNTIVFVMLIPFLKNNSNRRIMLSLIIAFVCAGLFITIVSIRNIGVLGSLNKIYLYPTFQADRIINVGNLLTRLELLTVTGFLTLGFLNLSILLYATVASGAEMLGLRTYRPLTIPVAILMAIIALINFKNITGDIFFAQQIYPLYVLPFQVGLPLLTLILAIIRGLPKD